MKTTYEVGSKSIRTSDMPYGAMGTIADNMSDHYGDLLLRTHLGFVLLSDPEGDGYERDPEFLVTLLPVGTKVTLEQTEAPE